MKSRCLRGKRPAWIRVIPLFLTVFLCLPAYSAPQKRLSLEKRQAIERAVAGFMSRNSIPGLSAAVVLDGKPDWSQGFGMADLENYSPATSSTLFRLGSVSKPISATAVLELWERGALDLDAPVQKYCPAFPQKDWPITTRELPDTSVVSVTTTRTVKATSPKIAPGISPASKSRLSSLPVIRW